MDFNFGTGPGAPHRPPLPLFAPVRPASPAQSHDSRPSRRSAGNKPSEQELYNTWRRLEDKEEQEGTAKPAPKRAKKKQQPKSPATSGSASQLQASPPLEAENMSRYPSSTGSVTRQLADADIHDSPPQDDNQQAKGGRKSPLGAVKQARAAFMRKARLTCVNCSARKVKCGPQKPKKGGPNRQQQADPSKKERPCLNAQVFNDYERKYQAMLSLERRQQAQQPQAPLCPPTVTPHTPSNLSNLRAPVDFFRIGAGPENLQSGNQETLRVRPGGGYPDPNGLLVGAQADIPRLREDISFRNLPRHNVPTSTPGPSTMSTRSDVSVGREVDPMFGIWKCNCPSCPGDQFFGSLDQLINHYGRAHGRFETYDPPESPFRWWCGQCKYAVAGPSPPTVPPTCRRHGTTLEMEYHGWTSTGGTPPEEEKVAAADPGAQPTVNPTGPGQQMALGAQTENLFFQFLTGGNGAYAPGGYGFRADGDAPDGSPGGDACGLASAAASLSAALYAHTLRRPLAGRNLLHLSALVLVLALAVTVVLPALARYRLPPLFPSLEHTAHLRRAHLAAAVPQPQHQQEQQPAPTDCVILTKRERPDTAEVYCRSERQSHKYEVPLADVQVQIRVHVQGVGANCSRRRQRVR